MRLEEGSRKWEEQCVRYAAVESICVLKATHNEARAREAVEPVESICVLKATHNAEKASED